MPIYTLWISRCIATARERIPGSIANYVTGVSECSQQRGNLKDNGYMNRIEDFRFYEPGNMDKPTGSVSITKNGK
ncbi:hypothetical protein BDD30_1109 [Photorhabdus asymbiotica]|uniref:Uncharacterized protein n=1 Tax=Photorhabdus asymbiotica TaxID=291112 RepID=A0ABX9STG0_9GAMM|nr:hypothetical protein BDD30_1109 [Photorhabdus asymbiotica]